MRDCQRRDSSSMVADIESGACPRDAVEDKSEIKSSTSSARELVIFTMAKEFGQQGVREQLGRTDTSTRVPVPIMSLALQLPPFV